MQPIKSQIGRIKTKEKFEGVKKLFFPVKRKNIFTKQKNVEDII